MTALWTRYFGIAFVLFGTSLVCPPLCTPAGALGAGLLLTVFYVLLRPVMQTIILPINALVWGLLTPLTDALLVWWASAWMPGFSVGYWQSVCIAICISLAYYPYSLYKKRQCTS